MKAARLFAAGHGQAEVARRLGVSRQSAHRWYRSWKTEGKGGLKGAGRAGRRAKLSDDQLKEVGRALRCGPQAFGFKTNLWTLQRLCAVIKKLTGVRYHPGHVWRLMGQMGWSLQRPAKRAKERNERAIAEWKQERWPKLKKAPGAGRRGSSSKMKAE